MPGTRRYEILFILDAGLEDAASNEKIDKVTAIIKDGGGEVVSIDKWGRRELAYEIDKKRMGFYALIQFEGSKPILDELDRLLKLDEAFLRYLTTRTIEKGAPAQREERGEGETGDDAEPPPAPAEPEPEPEAESTPVKEVDGFGAIT